MNLLEPLRYDFADVCRPITANEVLDVSFGRLAEIMSNRAMLKASLLESETRSVVGGGGIAEAGGGGGGGAKSRASASSGMESSGNSGKFCIDGAIPGPKSVI